MAGFPAGAANPLPRSASLHRSCFPFLPGDPRGALARSRSEPASSTARKDYSGRGRRLGRLDGFSHRRLVSLSVQGSPRRRLPARPVTPSVSHTGQRLRTAGATPRKPFHADPFPRFPQSISPQTSRARQRPASFGQPTDRGFCAAPPGGAGSRGRLPIFSFNSSQDITPGAWHTFVAVVGGNGNTGYFDGIEMTDRHYNFGGPSSTDFFSSVTPPSNAFWVGKGFMRRRPGPCTSTG